MTRLYCAWLSPQIPSRIPYVHTTPGRACLITPQHVAAARRDSDLPQNIAVVHDVAVTASSRAPSHTFCPNDPEGIVPHYVAAARRELNSSGSVTRLCLTGPTLRPD